MPIANRHVQVIEPMLLLRAEHLAEGNRWLYEVKFDGFRAVAYKSTGNVHLRSRNDKDFNAKYPAIVRALQSMPDETVIDGEIVVVDATGRPSFSALQNYGSASGLLVYYVFDVMIVGGEDVMAVPLERRREILADRVLSRLGDPVRESPVLEASLADLVQSVKAQGLEGLITKQRDSRYEPGQRSGAWQKIEGRRVTDRPA
jgi:bifunctional non-homologous end joining protein LigD